MNVNIRHVEKKDLDGCCYVEDQCYTTEEATKEKIEKRIDLYPEGFLIAELNGDIIGMINSTSTKRDDISDEELKDMVEFDAQGKNIVIFSVAVLPEYRGKGIAKSLLNKFLSNCKNGDNEKILLLCKDIYIKFYERFGFTLIGKSRSQYCGLELFEMILQLD